MSRLAESISHKRKRTGIIVPLIEDYHREMNPNHWDSDDIDFLEHLMRRIAEREKERSKASVFSPSSLGGCLRQSFFNKNWKKLGLERKFTKRIDLHFYFEYGTWEHLRFAVKIYQLSKRGELQLIGCEVPVESKRKDNGGTLDIIVRLDDVISIDFKGWNHRDFMRTANGDIPEGAAIQKANYVMMWNANKDHFPKIDRALIVAENKAGPTKDYPAALCEAEVDLALNMELARQRLKELRTHGERDTIPEAECTATTTSQFRDCPFRNYCRKEVKKREETTRKNPKRLKARIRTGARSDRTRRTGTR